jgi:dolichol-phosphate mannosyltransferase
LSRPTSARRPIIVITMTNSAIHIVVPVLNEAANLPRLTGAFRDLKQQFGNEYELHFLIVDDGSTDDTAAVARQLAHDLQLTILTHEQNQGPGRAFGTAYAHLAESLRDGDWVATMEGDNTSNHELVRQMLTRANEGYDVILASPYAYGGGIENTNVVRMFLSHVANAFIKGGLGITGIHTMSSFFRLHRGSTIRRLQRVYGPNIIEHAGFDGVVEMLMKMVTLHVTISEVPMVLDTSHRLGKSKMKVLNTIMNYFTLFFDRPRWVRLGRSEATTPIEVDRSVRHSHPSLTR